MLNQPTSSPMMTRMLGFFCSGWAAAGCDAQLRSPRPTVNPQVAVAADLKIRSMAFWILGRNIAFSSVFSLVLRR